MNTKLNQILAEISAGELFDKITILEIKKEKIKNEEKLLEISKELKSLTKTLEDEIPDNSNVLDLISDLKKINLRLWDIEEKKRLAEKKAKREIGEGKKKVEDVNEINVQEPITLDFITNPNKDK